MIDDRLKIIRKKNGLSQQQVADVLGVCRSAYCNYEIGRRKLDLSTIKKLGDFYKLSIDAFIGDDTQILMDEQDFEDDSDIRYLSQLSKEEKALIVKYRMLSAKKQNELYESLTENTEE